MTINLYEQWNGLAGKYCKSKKQIQTSYTQIESCYNQEHRQYHNLTHIAHLLQLAESLKDNIHSYDTFRFAIWFHDIVYDTKSKYNEENSANEAFKYLSYFTFSLKNIETVSSMIVKTRHEIELSDNESEDCRLFLDCDLEILASEKPKYKSYLEQLKQEYSWAEKKYNKARSEFLIQLLNKEYIYHSTYGRDKWESKARKNIDYELKILSLS